MMETACGDRAGWGQPYRDGIGMETGTLGTVWDGKKFLFPYSSLVQNRVKLRVHRLLSDYYFLFVECELK